MRDSEFSAQLRSGASDLAAAVNPPSADVVRRRGDRRRHRTMAASGLLAFAIGAGGGGVAYASLDQPGHHPAATAGASPTAGAVTSSPGARPGIVAVTTAGAIQVLDPVSGMATTTLVPPGDAVGDAIAVSPSGSTVYFSIKHGCTDDIESVPVSGGAATVVTTGVLPAISPNGTKLAFVREPISGGPQQVHYGCLSSTAASGKLFQVVVRNLSTGTEKVYPAPSGTATAPWFPVSHLSWAPSGQSLLVSAGPTKGNEGWGLVTLDVATASSYLPASWPAGSASGVPVTGQPDAATSYYREGVFFPDGDMFVDRVCCTGLPVRAKSTLLQEINANGQVVQKVAIGFNDRDHTSLAVDPSGNWLLYLSAHDLFLAGHGGSAFKLTTGLIAAAWLP